jgi:hypothetical protein
MIARLTTDINERSRMTRETLEKLQEEAKEKVRLRREKQGARVMS